MLSGPSSMTCVTALWRGDLDRIWSGDLLASGFLLPSRFGRVAGRGHVRPKGEYGGTDPEMPV